MKKYLVYIMLIVLGGLIGFIIIGDLLSNKLVNPGKNPYAYELDEFERVDPDMIKYSEIKRIGLNIPDPIGIASYKDRLGIAYKNHIQVIDTTGVELYRKSINRVVSCISFSPDGIIFLGCQDHLELFDENGNNIQRWDTISNQAIITSIAVNENIVYVANAGDQQILMYNYQGEILNSFDGKSRLEGKYGFIIPSPYFDVAIDPDNQLWVANTGLHYIENYTNDGSLRAYWGESSFSLEGFTGCCNPAHFIILSNGSFVTSEKGMVRIKIYLPSGELDCVVAAPDNFEKDSEPPDITADPLGRIYALDITKKMIRIFERNRI